MRMLDLFSGIGGFSLAAQWVWGDELEIVSFVEIDKFCQKVLRKHWPDVFIFDDIRKLTKESLWRGYVQNVERQRLHQIEPIASPVITKEPVSGGTRIRSRLGRKKENGVENRKRKFSGTMEENVSVAENQPLNFSQSTIKTTMEMLNGELGNQPFGNSQLKENIQMNTKSSASTVISQKHILENVRTNRRYQIDLLTGGFPCQPFSVAGKQGGKSDDRWLWPEMLRVIQEIRPRWVVAENVAGIVRMELDNCLSDLEGEGYSTQAIIIPACAVNAPHRRDRVWIVAYSDNSTTTRQREYGRDGLSITKTIQSKQGSQDVADSSLNRLERAIQKGDGFKTREGINKGCSLTRRTCKSGNWSVEPDVGRVATRLFEELDGGIDEILRILWKKHGTSEMVERAIRQHLDEKTILFNQMLWKLDHFKRETQENQWQEKGTTDSRNDQMRDLFIREWFTKASQRWKSIKQCSPELDGSLPRMSQERIHEEWNMGNIWLQEPNIPRVAKGIKERVNRLKSLGNAIVPQVAEIIFRKIKEIEGN